MHTDEPSDCSALIERLNACYEKHSGMISDMRVNHFEKQRFWFEFQKRFTELQLVTVLKFIHSELQRPGSKRTRSGLKLSHLIGNLSNFEYEWSLAKEPALRFPEETPRDKILRQTGRPVMLNSEPKMAPEIVAGLLAKWRVAQ